MKDILCLNGSAIRNAIREASTLNSIFHKNVISIVSVGQFADGGGLHMLLLTEYCPGGSLNDRLARPSSDQQNLTWMTQTAEAVAHLHSCNVVHRDLKADNVLLTASEDVKLGDFGLAREYIAIKRAGVVQDDGSWLAIYEQYSMQSRIGPIHWVAPEFLRGHYTEKADIFSRGTLLFAILERDYIVIDGKAIYGAFLKTNKTLFYAVSLLDKTSKIEPGKGSLTCYKVDTRMEDIQRSSSPKSKMAFSYRLRCMCCVLETNLTRKFAANLSLKIFLVKISTQPHTFVKQICIPNGNERNWAPDT